ncbi:DNA-binding transcriptional MerR regulator [Murinocardiopsis flavida]|uniref:DNA-binding transcriptional MerR regulator n=1 Tax=Murinocardiopsis flavida TaxID=645275 RepID=A0A2P8DS73_9ACTN|nr:MerR family transcriptional regulator [Murinocardiopsis flavida]PSL00062.1 DNA-binding transcriptional MerR regulator [Murinocardiopsis flavida]
MTVTTMRISQLAERSGVPATTLRYYEQRGLLPAHRSDGGYRIYDRDAVDRLAFIATGKRLGLGLDEIAELLGVWQDGACVQVKESLRPRIADRLAAAHDRIGELSAFAAMLHGAVEHLDTLPDRQDRCDPACGFLDLAKNPVTRTGRAMVEPAPDVPAVACSLDGDGIEKRIGRWQALLRGARREEAPGGLRVGLPAERAAEAAGLAAAEQRCCAFFSFSLRFDHGTVYLDVQAPAEARSMLIDIFGAPEIADEPDEPQETPTC